MNYSPDNLVQIPGKKGHQQKRVTGSQHVYFHKESRKTIIVPIHGKEDIPAGTFINIITQAGISKEKI